MSHRLLSALAILIPSMFIVSSVWPQSPSKAVPAGGVQAQTAATGQDRLLLRDGTPVQLFLADRLSSADATVGQRVTFQTIYPVSVNGTVVIPRGAPAWGTVTLVRRRGLMARAGKLTVEINAVRLADGGTASLRAIEKARGDSNSDSMKHEMEGTALVFYPATTLALLTKGENITLPKGMDVIAYVNGDVDLDPARFDPDEDEDSETPEVTDFRLLSVVQIRSTPDDAEILVDNKYDGVTPSVIRLAPGDHAIRVNRAGFKPWERTITLSPGGSQFITATLEPQ